jgi:hypothetical protein
MFLTGSVCLPHSTPPVVGSVLGLYTSCVGQQHSLECATVLCLGAQLASFIPHGVTSHKTVTFNNLSEVSGPARQYYSVRRPAAPQCYLGTDMADPEACDSVSARNNCDHWVAQLGTEEFGLHSSANPPYDVPGWLVTAAVTGNIFVPRRCITYSIQKGAEMPMRRQDECTKRNVGGNGSGYRWMVQLSLCTPWRHMGSGGKDPLILNQGTRSRWMVSVTAWPLYPREEKRQYPLSRKMAGWARSQSGSLEGDKYLCV